MIFVTVGTDNHPFLRLLAAADEYAAKSREPVIMQMGYSGYKPKHAEGFPFTDSKKIDELYRKADAVVCHAGAGSVINSLKYGKTPVVVPRLKSHGEHVNDHQADLAMSLGEKGKVIAVFDLADLSDAIKKARRMKRTKTKSGKMEKILEDFLGSL